MKRTISLLLCLLTLLSLTACGGKYSKEELQAKLDSVSYESINNAGNIENILANYGSYRLQYKSTTSEGTSTSEMVYTKDDKGNYVQQGKMDAADEIDVYTKDGASLYYYTKRNSGTFDVFPVAKYNENFVAYYTEGLLEGDKITKSTKGQSLVYEMIIGQEGEYEVYERKTFYINPDTLLPEKTVLEIRDKEENLLETIECTYTYEEAGKKTKLPEVLNMADDPWAPTLTVIDLDKNGKQLAKRNYPVTKGVEVSVWDFTETYTPYLDAACTTPMTMRIPISENMALYLKEN